MRNIKINKIFCVKTPSGSKKLVVCKKYESGVGDGDWSDVEVRDVDSKLEDDIITNSTQMAMPKLDEPIIIRDTLEHEYDLSYRNNQLTLRSLYELFSKFLEKPMTLEEFNSKTKNKIELT